MILKKWEKWRIKIEEKDREICVGKNRIRLGEDNIVYITACGEIDKKMAIVIKKEALKDLNVVEGKVNILIDLNKGGKPSPEARSVFVELYNHEKAGKVAFFGLHPVARVIAFFVMGISKNEDMRFFKAKEEALAWLKGESS